MPTSNPSCISMVADLLIRMKPRSILDVGPGFGKYGVLAREYCELWLAENLRKDSWKTQIDCVEAFEPYISDLHRYVYDNIYIMDIMNFEMEKLGTYDLVILSDVLEHLGREEGIKLMNSIKGSYIVTTPYVFVPQGSVHGNEFEKHVSQWNKSDFDHTKIIGNVLIGWRIKHAIN